MNKKTLKVLEYDKIIELVEERATSTLGKEYVKKMKPMTQLKQIKKHQTMTSEALALLIAQGRVPFGKIVDLQRSLKIAQIGSFLDPKQLLEVADSLRSARVMKTFLTTGQQAEAKYPNLFEIGNVLQSFKGIEEDIERCIISDSEISDDASPELRKIRREIENKNAAIRKKLDGIITSQSNQKYLQDSLVTIRQDRFVIPVKSEHKNAIKGLVHDQSAKGSTFYIEPMAVVELNNELRELKISEKKEIERILRMLTDKVSEVAEDILSNQKQLVYLDFIFAKGKYALDIEGIEPALVEKGGFRIKKGRHPLIAPKEVVPTNIWLGKDFTTLLVTGPNTGGKTVTLKTVGLLTLMAQSGLHIPAGYGTTLKVYKKIYADIGDEQSIEQSLSTFSSHMTNIVEILKSVDQNSLVLFDELGAGTDPTEGAALAMAILNELFVKKVNTIATTHYSELKEFAIVTEGVENASMEFDVASLSPTYRLLIGIPGKSNAFDISLKLGIHESIIQNAKELIHRDNIEFEDILSNIESSRLEADKERDEAIKLKLDLKKREERLQEKEERFSSRRDRIVGEAKADAKEILKKAKREADEIIKELQGLKTQSEKDKNKEIEAMRKRMKQNLEDVTENFLKEDIVNHQAPKTLKKGDSVKILSLNQVGTVMSKPNGDNEVMVQAGIMKMKVKIENLVVVQSQKKKNPTVSNAKAMLRKKTLNINPEIDLRGSNVEEAIMTLDKYLDNAAMSSLEKVRVIHGKGTGALRKGLQTYFKNHPHVKKYEYGAFNEGGDGVTVITLK